MALALRGAASVPNGNPQTSFTVGVDANVVAGDLLFLAVTSRDSTGAGTLAVTDNDTDGNAWAKIGNSTDHKATLWYKRATSGTASKTVTVANAVGSASGVLKAFSDGDAGVTPYTDVTVETNASGDETAAGITPDLANCMLCASIHNYGNDNAVTSLSSATYGAFTQTEKLSTGGSDCACAFGHVLTSGSNASGNTTWAQTNGAGYSISWFIKPAPDVSTGTFAATDPVDVAAVSADVIVAGSLAATDPVDAAAFSGDVLVSGSFAVADAGADTAAVSAAVAVTGTLAATDAVDVAAFEGAVVEEAEEITGTLEATDPLDAASLTGTVIVSGALAATDPVDSAAGEAKAIVSGTFALSDGSDSAAFDSAVLVQGTLGASEPLDAAALTVALAVRGELIAVDLPDTAAFLSLIAAVVMAEVAVKPVPGRWVLNHCHPYPDTKREQIGVLANALAVGLATARGRGASAPPCVVNTWRLARLLLDDHTFLELMNDPSVLQDLLAEHWNDAT